MKAIRELLPIEKGQAAVPDLNAVFATIYGRLPNSSEEAEARRLADGVPKENGVELFRAIVNGFDHQRLGTAFTVRFSDADLSYASFPEFELAVDSKDISVSVPLLHGHYEPHLIKFFSEILKPGMTFVDVGANVGFYSMLAASRVGKAGRVVSFEPNTENCRLLLLSAHRNGFENISLHPIALGNTAGYALFTTHIGSNGGLIPDTEETLTNPNSIIVPITRLENVITEKIDVMKIDVEGAEGLVIEGAKALVERHRPIVTTEFSLEMLPRVSGISGKDYLRYFTDHQYQVYMCDRQSHQLVLVEDVDKFVDEYGEVIRIEDLVFMPK